MENTIYSKECLLESNVMVKKWGNSQGIRLPKTVLDLLDISEGDTMKLYVDNESQSIILKRNRQKNRLKERLERFYNRPIDEISLEKSQEVDWGVPQGKEAW